MLTLNQPATPGKDYLDPFDGASGFDFTIKNVSSVPRDIRRDWYSYGSDAVHIEILAINGGVLTRPITLGRGDRAVAAASADAQTLLPGEESTGHIPLSELKDVDYEVSRPEDRFSANLISPLFTGSKPHTPRKLVTAIAVFDTGPNAGALGGKGYYRFWSGRVVSAPVTFNVWPPVTAKR